MIATPPPRGFRRAIPASLAGRVLLGLGTTLLLAIVVLVLLPDRLWKNLIVTVVSHRTHRQASIDGAVHVHLFRRYPELSAEGFQLANADWKPGTPMLRIAKFDATVSLISLLKFNPVFTQIRIEQPLIDLERDADNRANWDFTSQGAAKPMKHDNSPPARLPAIKQLILSGGTLTLSDAVRKLKFNGQLSIAENQSGSEDSALKVRGSGVLNGKPFALKVDGGPLLETDSGKPYTFDAAVSAADIKLNAHTTIPHPFDLAAITSRFQLSGKDLADVYYLTGLALPNSPPYEVSGTLVRNNLKFDADDFKGRFGGSDIGGHLSIDTAPERPKLTANLVSKSLNLADLATPLGTQASRGIKSGTLAQPESAPASASGTDKKGRKPRAAIAAKDLQAKESGLLLPDADLQVKRVRAMDADVEFVAASVNTEKLPIKRVHFHLVLDHAQISLKPLEFTLPQGQFSGAVAVNARGAIPETDLDMKLENLDLAQFKTKSSDSSPLAGEMVGRIRLHGAGASVHKAAANASGDLTLVVPHGEMRAAFAELTGINVDRGLGLLLTKKNEETAIRCGVASFHAQNGDLKANSLLIDTTHVLVTGTGDINLQDEGVDISLSGKPKEIRVLRIRTPIRVRGTLAHPTVGVDARKLAGQAGGAAVIGAVLTPLASLLVFVDGGLAKDANCAALVGQTEQNRDLPAAK
jgi:uncharacterized protein involved in outer membrane biogenesis